MRKIESVYENVYRPEEILEILLVDTLWEGSELKRRIDVAGSRYHHIELRTIQRGHGRAGLAIEVHEIECVELRKIETANAESDKRKEMDASNAAEAGDRNAF